MGPQILTLHRDELYKQVWEEPLTRLAKEYGISDVALKKICKKLKVPTPPIGYWAKRQYKKRLPRKPPLPKLRSGEPSYHTLQIQKPKKEVEKLDPEVNELIAAEMKRAKQIIVAEKLRAPHPLVRETQEVLSRAKQDEYGVLRPGRKRYLNIRVAPTSLSRALRIMNALIKGLEVRGFEVETEENKTPRTYVLILDEKIYFSLNERARREVHLPNAKEKRKLDRYRFSYVPPWDFVPTGELTLQSNVVSIA